MDDRTPYHGLLDVLCQSYPLVLTIFQANFTVPKTTPPGKYLLRVETAYGITHEFNVTQFYINCAHIEVNGPGGGKCALAVYLVGD